MKLILAVSIAIVMLLSCRRPLNADQKNQLQGTWKLITGTVIEKGDTTETNYGDGISMIKIINATHFSFLNHDMKKGVDSTSTFSAGGGQYSLVDDQYTEHLEYCSYREWEGNTFHFKVTINGDTLIQEGIERIEDLGVERLNIEKYLRINAQAKSF
jgi:hypothetical protein